MNHLLWVVCALGPVLALFCIIRVYPILETIRLSFYRYHPTQRTKPFIGFDNYIRLLEDDAFHTALINTLQFCILAVVITLHARLHDRALAAQHRARRRRSTRSCSISRW